MKTIVSFEVDSAQEAASLSLHVMSWKKEAGDAPAAPPLPAPKAAGKTPPPPASTVKGSAAATAATPAGKSKTKVVEINGQKMPIAITAEADGTVTAAFPPMAQLVDPVTADTEDEAVAAIVATIEAHMAEAEGAAKKKADKKAAPAAADKKAAPAGSAKKAPAKKAPEPEPEPELEETEDDALLGDGEEFDPATSPLPDECAEAEKLQDAVVAHLRQLKENGVTQKNAVQTVFDRQKEYACVQATKTVSSLSSLTGWVGKTWDKL